MNLMKCSTAWNADIFPGLFLPWVDGGKRWRSSKMADISLSQPGNQWWEYNICTLKTGTMTNNNNWKESQSYHLHLQQVDSALFSKSRSSVLGTSPWLSVITFALILVGHFSKKLLAVSSPKRSLKSCSICNTKTKCKERGDETLYMKSNDVTHMSRSGLFYFFVRTDFRP